MKTKIVNVSDLPSIDCKPDYDCNDETRRQITGLDRNNKPILPTVNRKRGKREGEGSMTAKDAIRIIRHTESVWKFCGALTLYYHEAKRPSPKVQEAFDKRLADIRNERKRKGGK